MDEPVMELWELTARERIRDTLARYTWSGDSLRLDALARVFCEDGVLEVRGQTPLVGRDAICAFIHGVGSDDASPHQRLPADDHAPEQRRIVRHNVTNVRFLELTTSKANLESYFTVVTEIGLDHMGRYSDTFVPVEQEWLISHRRVSTDWRAPGSTMAPPSAIN